MAMCNCMEAVFTRTWSPSRGPISVGGAVMLALTAAAAVSPRLIGGWRQAEVAAVRPSIVNCTWQNFTQKIDHFGDAPGTFPQRLCLYDKWWRPGGGAGGQFRAAADAPGPILFYTGNESPVDEYVNNTGLMWEIGERLGALLLLAHTNRARRTTHLQCFDETKSAIALRFAFPAYGNWIGKVMAVGRQWG